MCGCVIEPKILPDRPGSKAAQKVKQLHRQIRAPKRENPDEAIVPWIRDRGWRR
jgi:hypothetical protein